MLTGIYKTYEVNEPRPPYPARLGLTHLEQALQGLAHLSKIGIIHADLKPQNMGVRGNGTLAILDFGSAVYSQTRIIPAERSKHLLATPQFAAPEVLRAVCGRERGTVAVSTKADVWAVAMVFYSTLTGRMPYVRRDERDARKRLVSYLTPDQCRERVNEWMNGEFGPHRLVLQNLSPEQKLLHGLCLELLQVDHEYRSRPGNYLARNLAKGSVWDKALLIPITAAERVQIEQAAKFEEEFPIGLSIEGVAQVRAERENTRHVTARLAALERQTRRKFREYDDALAELRGQLSSLYVY